MRFSTDFRFGSPRDPREADVQESSLPLEALAVAAGTGFFFTVPGLEARASKGEMNSNMDLRGDGGACCGGWETGMGWGGEGSSLGGSWGT